MSKQLAVDVKCRSCVLFYQRSNLPCRALVCLLESERVYKRSVKSKQLKVKHLLGGVKVIWEKK